VYEKTLTVLVFIIVKQSQYTLNLLQCCSMETGIWFW